MGCDFYEYIYIHVEWSIAGKLDSGVKEFNMKRHYYYDCSDSDESYDLEDQIMDVVERGKKVLYKNGKWKISSTTRIKEYISICDEMIPEDAELIGVDKYSSCILR